jgi:hypothetical protein
VDDDKLAPAFLAAQRKMQNPAFDATNPHFKNKYASLAAVREAVIPPLLAEGITVAQDLKVEAGGLACYTILTHASGQRWTFGPLTLPVSQGNAQGFGSAATYARRYSLMAVCGVVGDDDDDGEQAVKADKPAPESKPAPSPAIRETRLISEGQRKRLYAISKQAGWTDEELRALVARHGYKSSKDIPMAEYEAICFEAQGGPGQHDPEPGADDEPF